MKRYVSLAGAMLIGTVVAQEKKAAFKGEVAVKTQAAELKEAPATIALEGTRPVYRSEASPFIADEVKNSPAVERRDSRVSKKSPTAVVVEDRHTSRATSRAFSRATSFAEVEKRGVSSVISVATPEVERNGTHSYTSDFINNDSPFDV
jgi:hypothetical protein